VQVLCVPRQDAAVPAPLLPPAGHRQGPVSRGGAEEAGRNGGCDAPPPACCTWWSSPPSCTGSSPRCRPGPSTWPGCPPPPGPSPSWPSSPPRWGAWRS
jgi:hypothetical protein